MSIPFEIHKYLQTPSLILPRLRDKCVFPLNLFSARLWVKFQNVKKSNIKQRIFIFGAFGGRSYNDNSVIFFEYFLLNHPEIDCFWVMRADAYREHAKKTLPLPPLDKLLIKDSFRANVMVLNSNAIIYSHGRSDVTDYKKREMSKDTAEIMLTHGIAAFKKTNLHKTMEGKYIAEHAADADLIIANSFHDAEIKTNKWGIPKEKIAITGLPRYDRLFSQRKKMAPQKDRILFMPTWRSWNSNKTSLNGSSFTTQIAAFLSKFGLDNYLGKNGISIHIYIHMWMREFYDEIKQALPFQNIIILDQGCDLQETILKSSLLITDYSSICWDFLFLDKPVIFYQFDLDEYLEHTGTYIDLKKDLFGPVVYNAEDAASWVRYFVENDFSVAPFLAKMEEMKNLAFAYNDGRNCERLAKTIFYRFPECR